MFSAYALELRLSVDLWTAGVQPLFEVLNEAAWLRDFYAKKTECPLNDFRGE